MIQTITLVGAGNLATQLGKALAAAGLEILQIYSRTKESAAELAEKLNCSYTTELSGIRLDADLVIFSVKDDALKDVMTQLELTGRFIAHTSGSISMDVLKDYSDRYGVFYPLQTFSKQRDVDFSEIPICLEAASPVLLDELKLLATRLSQKVNEISSAQRQSLHVAAVFICNFVNHFYYLGQKVVEQNGVDFELLKPLITETAEKVMTLQPLDAQTGPAKRFDETIINKHLKFLSDQPELKEIYSFVTQRIFEVHKSR